MKQRIEISFTREELNSFLNRRYGYGIWEFELSLYQTYIMYYHGLRLRAYIFETERISKLKGIKRKILELIDNYLSDINFYKYSSKGTLYKKVTGISKWTTEKRAKFIIKNFKIEQLFSIIDELIEHQIAYMAASEFDASLMGVESPMRLKPLNFLVLIWSYAMKERNRVDWINMEQLLLWFSKEFENTDLSYFFDFKKKDSYPPEKLRLSRNKYRNSKYDELANYIFINFFKNAKKKFKKEYPKIINWWELMYVGGKMMDEETLLGFKDVMSCLYALFPDFSNRLQRVKQNK
jgi:hypothetical protein